MLLADLTGHGVTAALFMALLKYISQETPEEVRVLPGYFLNYLDMEFYGQIPNGFFTAFAATAHYNEKRQVVEIDYSNAAHPVSIIIRTDGSYELLESGHFAIGLMDLVERKPHTNDLNFGDRLYAYTDGFLESIDPDGNEFGLEALCKTLAAHRHLPLKDSIQKAYDALASFSQSDEPQDDLTILAIEARPKPQNELDPLDPNEDPWDFN
ncbi:Stage II sporulation protein E, putative [Verrucomicrobiia bacterium DG1235]|nr:Stage II sporulation protein E, putative [Verrucomicrobiae bacterium DG1235]